MFEASHGFSKQRYGVSKKPYGILAKILEFSEKHHKTLKIWQRAVLTNSVRAEPRKVTKKQKWSRTGQRSEPSTSRYHRSARNFATILMVPTVLRVTDLKISNFSWSEPEIINIIKCIMINGLIPYIKTTSTLMSNIHEHDQRYGNRPFRRNSV